MVDSTVPNPGRPFPLYRALFIGATLLVTIASAQHWAIMQVDADDPTWRTIRHALLKEAPVWYLWFAAAPILRWAVRFAPFSRSRLYASVPFHCGLALALSLVHMAAVIVAYRITGFPTPPGPLFPVLLAKVPFNLAYGFVGYGTLLMAILAADYYDRLRERELAAAALGSQLAEARLQALRMQLNPHFLFNAMNAIAMLVRRKADAEAIRMLAGLSEILRQVLVESPPIETTLKEELAFIERYLAIEQARFGDRLVVRVDLDPAATIAMVPTLILQPLVENAIRHGIARRAAAGAIEIVARADGDRLEIKVQDDGPGPHRANDVVTPTSGIPISNGGIGLRNTERRLAALYGAAGRFELIDRPGGGAIARITMPFRAAPTAMELEAMAEV